MRRFWIALLAMALMVPSALAQSAAVNVGDWDVDSYAMLLNVETGELYTAQQEWIRINRLDGTPDDAPLFAAMPAVLTTAAGISSWVSTTRAEEPAAETARRLVVRGFFADVVQHIGVPELQDRLMATIERRLGALPDLDDQPVEVA